MGHHAVAAEDAAAALLLRRMLVEAGTAARSLACALLMRSTASTGSKLTRAQYAYMVHPLQSVMHAEFYAVLCPAVLLTNNLQSQQQACQVDMEKAWCVCAG